MNTLKIERDARGVAMVAFNRPEVHNAFDETMIREVIAAFRDLGEDESVRVIIIAAEGKSFCAGADLNWMKRASEYDEDQNREDAGELALMLNAIYACPKPVIARVQGNAFGGGVGVVAAADIAIGVADVQFALSEVKLGIIPAVISPYVIESIGARYAHRYFITAERFSGSEAYRIGLLHDLASSVEAMDEMIAGLCSILLSNGPKAITAAKNLIQAVAQKPIDDELMEDTIERIAQIRSTPEAKEGIGAFLGKRRPNWVKE
ncbi:MAG: enoyl-CoA hydratase/isomerase family protein [Burkholderiales bacterium]|nr:enoyl-CoA hydratase/isomerase family protein [Burkholderiales bacterium]